MLIGLSGKKESGKSTSAVILSNILSSYYTQVQIKAFADPIKDALSVMLGIHRANLDDSGFKKRESVIPKPTGGYYTYRELMQEFGTGVGRQIHPDFWVLATAAAHKDKIVIIEDVRFPNEYDYIKSQGGVLIRLNKIPSVFDEASMHISETALDNHKFDYVVDNNESLKGLEDKLLTITKTLSINLIM